MEEVSGCTCRPKILNTAFRCKSQHCVVVLVCFMLVLPCSVGGGRNTNRGSRSRGGVRWAC
jgi:hypothetical protein